MTSTPAMSSKPASHRPDIADGADARAVHCGLCNWKTAIYKHGVFGVQALTERYWQDAPYGLHFLPILVFGFVWVYLVEPKLVPALLPFKWRAHGA